MLVPTTGMATQSVATAPGPTQSAQPPTTMPAESRPASLPAGRQDEWDRSEKAREAGVAQFGGTPRTENAVEAGLSWLAAHQSQDGTWDRLHFDRECPVDDRCPGAAVKRETDDLTAGVTGLALLAFLGAGYTDRAGPYQDVVRAAVDALLKLQEPHGGFSRTDSMAGYNDALATLSLAEYFALTAEARVSKPLERVVASLAASQQPLGGWDYGRSPGSGRNDTSITAWVVQALHACAAAGIEVPRSTLVRAALHFERAREPDGWVRYSDSGAGFRLDEGMRPVYRHGPGMAAAGLMCEQLLGWRLDGATAVMQRGLLLSDLPSSAKARGGDPTGLHNEYYWYYGTLALFQRGGEDWDRWNSRLRDALLPLQNRAATADGRKRHAYGSWPPFGTNWGMFGRMGGRVYTTAICTLTLEIYYRHTPAFLKDQVLFSADDWRPCFDGRPPRERLTAVACLAQLRVEVAEPVLVNLLAEKDRRVALAAAEALASMDSPMGLALLERAMPSLSPGEQRSLERALQRAKVVAGLPPVEGHVRVYDPARRLATLELPRSYVGMSVQVYRGDQPVGQMRVIQRFTGRTVVVAELVGEGDTSAPQAGDRVVGQ
jgi:hypothetical protein